MSDGSKVKPEYQVKVIFDGLCPLVPGQEGAKQEWVGAFLVDAGFESRVNFGVDLPVHFPFLEYNVKDLVGMENAPDARVRLPLKQVDIAFVPPVDSEPGLNILLAPAGQLKSVPSKSEDGNFFDWVTSMEEVTPGSGKVAAECFEPNPSRRLVARVHMTQGRLQTEILGEVPLEGEPLMRDFVVLPRKGAGAEFRAVAKKVSLAIPCSAGEFRIKMLPFGDTENAPKELIFRQPPADGEIEIGILNLCARDLLPGSDLEQADPLGKDDDFRWNYLVSEGEKELLLTAEVPGPFQIASELGLAKPHKGGGGGDKGALCNPPKTGSISDGARGLMLATAARLR